MIYKWMNADSRYAQYDGKEEVDDTAITWMSPVLGDPLPPLSQWRTPTLTQYIGDNSSKSSKIIADCVRGLSPYINQKSVDALADIWDKHATLYPVILDDRPNEPYYMVVVNTVIDCIDREASIGNIDKNTLHGKKGYFSGITQWVFREDEIGDNDIFVLPDDPSTNYVTERFKQRVIEAELTGFGFVTEQFDDNPFVS
ncbi:hypothetical protein KRX19_06510 [Cardiobacteriaceae bacterium TAE3-ERU3]|nr:hypothetical protein [Cardiobacteriaceae bacterium TAE3-ERU3]